MTDEEIVNLVGCHSSANHLVMRAILDGIVEASKVDRKVLISFLEGRRDQTKNELAKMLLSDLIGDIETSKP